MTTAVREHVTTELGSILNRWTPRALDATRCLCPDCRRLRAEPFACSFCGYEGEPWVWACTCPDRAARDVEEIRSDLAELRHLNPASRLPAPNHAETVGARIAWLEKALPVYEDRAREGYHKADEAACDSCHGHRECPVCESPEGSSCGDEQAQAAYGMVRDVRLALRARGLI